MSFVGGTAEQTESLPTLHSFRLCLSLSLSDELPAAAADWLGPREPRLSVSVCLRHGRGEGGDGRCSGRCLLALGATLGIPGPSWVLVPGQR